MKKENIDKYMRGMFDFKCTDYQLDFADDCLNTKRVVAVFCRQSGKTETTSKVAIMLARRKKRGDVLVFAPTERQTELIADKIGESIRKMPYLTDFHIIRQTQSTFKFNNMRSIICMTSALLSEGETLRGFTAGDIIIEEAGSIKDSIIQSVIMPMGATTDPTIIKIGTPRGKNHFYESAKDKNYKVHNYDYTYPVRAGLIQQSYIDEQRLLSTETAFRTEYGAEFIADSDAYFSYELVDNCTDNALPWDNYVPVPGKDYYIGADIARLGQDSTCIMIVEKNDSTASKVVQIVDIPKSKLDYVIERLRQLITYYNPRRVFIDETGLGAGVSDILARDYNMPRLQQGKQVSGFPHNPQYGDKIVGVKFTIQSKLDLYSNLQVLMNNSRISYPAHPKLISQLRDFRYELTTNQNVKLHHSERGFDDYCDALVLAVKELAVKRVGYAF
jgi:hypothetical protein